MAETPLLQTPLHDLHLRLGARMVPFAGYAMPVQYPTGLMAEHKQCRESAALFDVSHMGQVRLVGADAARGAGDRWCRWTSSTSPSAGSAMPSSPTPAAACSTT